MLNRNVLIIFFLLCNLPVFLGCRTNQNTISLPSFEYDLKTPAKLVLVDALAEISGISFYPADSSIFAISDESGYLYKIHLNKRFLTEQWGFGKKRDYEDVIQYGSAFYILESNGNIETLNFGEDGDTIYLRRTIFPGDNNKLNEFESIYYDDQYKGFVMICKDCEDDTYDFTSAYMYDPVTDKFSKPIFKIDLNPIAKKIGIETLKFRPSAAAINPLTNDVWILSSTNQLIVVIDRKGNMKDVYTIDPGLFNQPEGISFTPWGDLLIANEAGDEYHSATLLIFKPKNKG
ncbi:MAG: SdiA-regulated domain-containing protein [Ginsengibacter sp.]